MKKKEDKVQEENKQEEVKEDKEAMKVEEEEEEEFRTYHSESLNKTAMVESGQRREGRGFENSLH